MVLLITTMINYTTNTTIIGTDAADTNFKNRYLPTVRVMIMVHPS